MITQLSLQPGSSVELVLTLAGGAIAKGLIGVVGKVDGLIVRTAEEVNALFPKGWQPPYLPGTKVVEFITTNEEKFVRVYSGEKASGAWIIKESEISGLSPVEIQQKFSLPSLPTTISDVTIPSGTALRV